MVWSKYTVNLACIDDSTSGTPTQSRLIEPTDTLSRNQVCMALSK